MTDAPLNNRFHIQSGHFDGGSTFGPLTSVHPVHHVAGQGHIEHIKIRFSGGVWFTLTLDDVQQLLQQLAPALATFPHTEAL